MMLLAEKSKNKLLETAKLVSQKAYAPYSHFNVGAAVLSNNDQIFSGCNVENASFGATICAERVAITKAISEGASKILALALFTPTSTLTMPCGVCRQVMSEFMDPTSIIYISSLTKTVSFHFKELFPNPFNKTDLQKTSIHEK